MTQKNTPESTIRKIHRKTRKKYPAEKKYRDYSDTHLSQPSPAGALESGQSWGVLRG